MKGTHPPTLITHARRALTTKDDALGKIERGTRILIAVSGGPDSMALLDVLAKLAPKLGLLVSAHGVDHGLREDASRELDLAEKYADKIDVQYTRSRVHVAAGGNVQARAREARYEALRKEAARIHAKLIATAHHADDRAETVLIRILRGAPPSGLAVLPARESNLMRPIIRATRADVRAHLERHRVPFANDPSNMSPRFLRVRVRHELMPLLTSLDPQIVRHLCALADALLETRRSQGESPLPLEIPHRTRVALAEMVRQKADGTPGKNDELWLPSGLVVRRVRTKVQGHGPSRGPKPRTAKRRIDGRRPS